MTLDETIAELATRRRWYMERYASAGILPEQWTFTDWEGTKWVFSDCNDLGVPYFHRPGQKTLFTVSAASAEFYDHVKATEYNERMLDNV